MLQIKIYNKLKKTISCTLIFRNSFGLLGKENFGNEENI